MAFRRASNWIIIFRLIPTLRVWWPDARGEGWKEKGKEKEKKKKRKNKKDFLLYTKTYLKIRNLKWALVCAQVYTSANALIRCSSFIWRLFLLFQMAERIRRIAVRPSACSLSGWRQKSACAKCCHPPFLRQDCKPRIGTLPAGCSGSGTRWRSARSRRRCIYGFSCCKVNFVLSFLPLRFFTFLVGSYRHAIRFIRFLASYAGHLKLILENE